MPLLVVALAVVVLLILMMRFKLNGFIALILVATLVAFWAVATGSLSVDGEPAGVADIPEIITEGLGGQLGSTAVVIGLGAMIGRVMGDAGAAQRIARKILSVFGERGVQWAMIISAMLIGVTMFYEVAFVILVPVAFTLVRATKVNLLWVGLPMSISLSTMHSFLPPHPGPTAVAGLYNASVGLTLAYGLLIAIPAGVAIAMAWPRLSFVRQMNPQMPSGLLAEKDFADDELPSGALSFLVALLPIVLIAGSEILRMTVTLSEEADDVLALLGSAEIALLIALLVAIAAFGPLNNRSMAQVAKSMSEAARAMAMILLVIGAGGAFKQVLVSAGIADYIADTTAGWNLSPLFLAWIIAVILRIALGSATVAVSTAAGIAAPLVAATGASPELMVLATACGSIAFSHVNDPGFWMFKEYFNLNVGQALAVRTTYTTTLAVLGLLGVFALDLVIT
ncbi:MULTISPECIES: gluconate:H+ symporter [Actinomycetes]|jgi:Gnt-I system high-affinity gluconate transporter|uniref:Gluconate permease n=1 Tax=Glutamicibacter arilaitensis TaxID=256701 RepID=A0A4Y8TY33_9MICC|nr:MULTISPECIES: gluconate:H+ symporter [Micrococcaceae]PQZ90582.1 gluconate permease [Arthrobacter sp. MYb222]TDU26020.1 Gnt-I system high-affinity gluconate transporter [Arthrobacter sp. JUb115]TFH56177.1 gluconate permease [Glutamicibacter arilaitensis]